MAEQIRVLIIGAGTKGAIGPLSHARAFSRSPFCIVGFVDPEPGKAKRATKVWGGEAFVDSATAFDRVGTVDVVTVATPDETHAGVLGQLLGEPAQLIFAEKPFTQASRVARELLEQFQGNGQEVMVNYTRRFVEGFHDVRSGIANMGQFLGGSAFYNKGLHNLCHWVDTFLMVGIDPKAVNYVEIDRSKLNVFESFLYFEDGRLDILDFGEELAFTRAIPRGDFLEDRILGYDRETTYSSRLGTAMENAAQNIADHLLQGVPLIQDAWDTVRVLEICEQILK